jgi:hypothetical protein
MATLRTATPRLKLLLASESWASSRSDMRPVASASANLHLWWANTRSPCQSDSLHKKVFNVVQRYPDLPKDTAGQGGWVGELLVAETGNVVRVWTLREPDLTPPFPAFTKAITDAVSRWRFSAGAPKRRDSAGCPVGGRVTLPNVDVCQCAKLPPVTDTMEAAIADECPVD